MSYLNRLTNTATVWRLIITTGVKSTYQVVENSIPCLIQPVTAEYAAGTGMVYGRTYNGYFTYQADIQIGDKVFDSGGKEYRVTGSMNRNYGTDPHLTVLMTEQTTGGGKDQ